MNKIEPSSIVEELFWLFCHFIPKSSQIGIPVLRTNSGMLISDKNILETKGRKFNDSPFSHTPFVPNYRSF